MTKMETKYRRNMKHLDLICWRIPMAANRCPVWFVEGCAWPYHPRCFRQNHQRTVTPAVQKPSLDWKRTAERPSHPGFRTDRPLVAAKEHDPFICLEEAICERGLAIYWRRVCRPRELQRMETKMEKMETKMETETETETETAYLSMSPLHSL